MCNNIKTHTKNTDEERKDTNVHVYCVKVLCFHAGGVGKEERKRESASSKHLKLACKALKDAPQSPIEGTNRKRKCVRRAVLGRVSHLASAALCQPNVSPFTPHYRSPPSAIST
ncbi:hypothetical protein E2C01_092753 [Portunus trituberculatus]|uniref:Uncharacterized protein n=1 Tax=Portunus trituberculatus TaxID=210409 RepID=A0A5B7JW99_PORTR|nr:hypothetical protein [Portunus trituberculatus]